ncbi:MULTISPECIES: CdaR family transcriptional regulator [Neobacillus]|uniref:Helix-turn-helix domain-containing protein n=1 Tax=Neobacillus rhizophilus TaxID=2833579 RepID=A0A942YUY7_9BACI|nr:MULTISPECIES: sugar diacid recognition domain-containing protein [Neobacillus]MBS4214498.1 helix-turn-helix domain-containing protein [Neobacillus rhizophilus]MBU8918403.1 helix-turn-helix domain-containing protein [Bacillus sp. FJAT-29953]
MLTKEIASTIVKETSLRLDRNINIMDEHGIIIASRNSSRIGDIHEGALAVLKTGKTVTISEEQAKELKGSQPGINLPIVFKDIIVGVIGITGNPIETQDFGGLVKMTTELMIMQNYISTQLEWQQRTKDMILEELLKSVPSITNIERGLSLLEKRLHPPFISCVIQMNERSISNNTLIKQLELTISGQNAIIGFININRIFIAFSECTLTETSKVFDRIAHELRRLKVSHRLSFSTPFSDIKNFQESYLDCDLALDITDKTLEIVPFSKVESKALIYKIKWEDAEKFSKRIMNSTLKSYLETLEAFFDHNLNIQNTADALFIHRNTLIYRLNKIKEETGYDPKDFRDALTLQLAIWATNKIELG